MKAIGLFPLELGRLLQSRPAWFVMALTLLSPCVGLTLYRPAVGSTMQSIYLANPALAGGVAGGVLFGLLTIFELDRVHSRRADALVDAAVSPLTFAWVRLLALITTALMTFCATAVLWFPVARAQIGSVFDNGDYVSAAVLLMGLALPLAILAAAAAYQFTRRMDLSLVLFAVFAGLSLTIWADDWQLCWLNPCVWAMSDDFSNDRIFRSVAYVRLTWLAALSGVWALSYLCIRQYGKSAAGSFARSVRRVYRPAAALALLICSSIAYAAQPFIDQSNPDLSAMELYMLEPLESVVCVGRSAKVFPDVEKGSVSGTALYQLQNTSGREQVVTFGVNPGYAIHSATANGSETAFAWTGYQESNMAQLEVTIPAEENIELTLEYGGFPRDWSTQTTMQGEPEISREYLRLENQNLSPILLDVSVLTGIWPFTVEITLPGQMVVIPFTPADAELVAENSDGTKTWRFETSGSSGTVYAGDYVRQDIEAGGFTVRLYYGRKHQAIMEQANAVQAVRQVVEYCTEHYGPLSFASEGGSLKLIQARVTGGGYAANGCSLLDEQDFTAQNLSDPEKGAVPGEVFIHELVHQWWGLGNMFDTAGAGSPWSAEGLTVYTTYRIVKELYGDDYAQEHYVNQWRAEVEDYYLNFYIRHPEYLQKLPEAERLRIENDLAYVRWYSEMPLMLLKAEELVGGEEAMDSILHGLFNRELDWSYPYLTYQEFLDGWGLTEEDLSLA